MKRWRIILDNSNCRCSNLHFAPFTRKDLGQDASTTRRMKLETREFHRWLQPVGNTGASCNSLSLPFLFVLWLHSIPCGKLTYPMVVQGFLSYREGLSSGAILVWGRVKNWATQGQIHLMWYLMHIFTSPFHIQANNDVTHFRLNDSL